MTMQDKISACLEFWKELCARLLNTHELVQSCNNDISAYLIPHGSIAQLSYYGKPAQSFRLSDHWNWYSSLKRCGNEHYIQCFSVDAPWAAKRVVPGKPTAPVTAIQVCYFGKDKKYHAVFGEVYDRKTKTWAWKEVTVDEAIKLIA